jgi:uncharacterized protein DUF6596/sigma-70-like protein
MQDDRLRLIFTCCHPALSMEAQVALTLRLLGGLSTEEVARSFLVTEPTMAQRLARAKRKIKAARIPYRLPEDHELPDRLCPVLAVVYLVYNAGLTSPAEPGLCSEAIRLARILATLMPDEPEVGGLLALLLLTESRRASRTRPDGSLVLLGEQDRRRWDRALIEEGQAIVRRCIRRNQPGAYQLQAAINAVHADAAAIEQTDWSQIVALYDQLVAVAPTPVVALNRAIAIARCGAPPLRSLLWTNWTWTTTTRSTPHAPICFGSWAGTARPRPPTSVQPPWRRRAPSGTSSGSVAELRAEGGAKSATSGLLSHGDRGHTRSHWLCCGVLDRSRSPWTRSDGYKIGTRFAPALTMPVDLEGMTHPARSPKSGERRTPDGPLKAGQRGRVGRRKAL